jgi:hypothetical protein
VRPAKPGYSAAYVKPVYGYLEWAKGSVITPKGEIKVSWSKEDSVVHKEIVAPEGLEIIE